MRGLGGVKKILFLLLLSISGLSIADQENTNTKDENTVAPFFGTGNYEGGDLSGLGVSLGLVVKRTDDLYTVRSTFFFDIFDSIVQCSGSSDPNCEEDKVARVSELAFLYGKRWKDIRFSAGLGQVKGENVGSLFKPTEDREDFSTLGLAYSVHWFKHATWLGPIGFELSGNINSEHKFYVISGRATFGSI